MTGPIFSPSFIEQLGELFRWRRDVRHFDPRPLDDGVIDLLLDQASLAPSVGYSQPSRFVRVLSPSRRQAIIDHVDVANALAARHYTGERRSAYEALKLHGLNEAPEHLAVFCDEDASTGHGLGRQTMPETLAYSTVLAIHALWLAARARQIGMGWISIIRPDEVARLLDVPDHWRLVAYLCLGYPAVASAVPELELRGWETRLETQQTRFVR